MAQKTAAPLPNQTYICPIMGKVAIGKVRCQELCRQPRNNTDKCSVVKCRSPFRVCRNCVLTHAEKPQVVSDPDTGLCIRCSVGKMLRNVPAAAPAEKTAGGEVVSFHKEDAPKPQPATELVPLEDIPVVTPATDPQTLFDRKVYVPTELIDYLPGQPRKNFDEGDMMSLTMSIREEGQHVPGEVVPLEGRYRLTDGERRFRACRRLGIPFKTVVQPFVSYAVQKRRSIVMNFNRKAHDPVETALAINDLRQMIRDDNAAKGVEQSENRVRLRIVAALGYSISSVGNYLKIFDQLDPRVVELMKPAPDRKTLRTQLALELTSYCDRPERQFELARQMVAKDMKYAEGRNFLAAEARKDGVTEGRGRERQPADQRDVLETALHRIGPTLLEVLNLSEYEFRRMFEKKDPAKFTRLLALAKERLEEFQELVEHLETIEESFVPLEDAAGA